MKNLYMIGGPMGVGKTTACQSLKNKLDKCVFLDGDWCWDMHPFQVTAETKKMVLENIAFLLNNFIGCPAYENIIFCWVMHEQEIVDGLLARLDTAGCRVHTVSLVCSEEVLRKRIEGDVKAGIRAEDAVRRSLNRLLLYEKLDTVKIDVSRLSPEETAARLMRLGSLGEESFGLPPLETESLLLRKAEFEDWRSLYRNVLSRPEAARHMAWRVAENEEEGRERLKRTIQYQRDHDAYLVIEKASGEAIGFAGFEETAPHVYQETGIALGPEYTGRGYGKQILGLLLETCRRLGGKQFFYSAREANTAARALALSWGFVRHHRERRTLEGRGTYVLEVYCKEL